METTKEVTTKKAIASKESVYDEISTHSSPLPKPKAEPFTFHQEKLIKYYSYNKGLEVAGSEQKGVFKFGQMVMQALWRKYICKDNKKLLAENIKCTAPFAIRRKETEFLITKTKEKIDLYWELTDGTIIVNEFMDSSNNGWDLSHQRQLWSKGKELLKISKNRKVIVFATAGKFLQIWKEQMKEANEDSKTLGRNLIYVPVELSFDNRTGKELEFDHNVPKDFRDILSETINGKHKKTNIPKPTDFELVKKAINLKDYKLEYRTDYATTLLEGNIVQLFPVGTSAISIKASKATFKNCPALKQTFLDLSHHLGCESIAMGIKLNNEIKENDTRIKDAFDKIKETFLK